MRDRECMICKEKSNYYFSKSYDDSPVNIPLSVDYFKCSNCNFVFSGTHQDMSEQEWQEINDKFHHGIEQDQTNRLFNQPPYAEMSLALKVLAKNKLIDLSDCLDYAAGYGTLAKALDKYFDNKIKTFDAFVNDPIGNPYAIDKTQLGTYKTVINTAMFEHVITRNDLENVNQLVNNDGVLVIHTFISERHPSDPNWFYLEPIVHTAFHTNKSMSVLMDEWGYSCSVYSPTAKIWLLFKEGHDVENIRSTIRDINFDLQTEFFHFKTGFVDYWKD